MVAIVTNDDVAPEFGIHAAALSLWAKSPTAEASRAHLLLQHLFDSLAVGEVVWDRYLAGALRRALDQVTDGRGRMFFALLCGMHDIGKATPKFQSKQPELAQRVREAGLSWNRLSQKSGAWHHTLAGAAIFRTQAPEAGWSAANVNWVWPMIGGHHGTVPTSGQLEVPRNADDHRGGERWDAVQHLCLVAVVEAAGFRDLPDAEPSGAPTVGHQLALSGAVIMADWLASNAEVFAPIDDPAEVGIELARRRAPVAWDRLDLRSGWNLAGVPADPMGQRFSRRARPLQSAAQQVATQIAGPGLMILEAPMGEGKTEAALVAAEIQAWRFGERGVFVGMPTQATSDPMFDRVDEWRRHIDPQTPVILLHGKRMFNQRFEALRKPLELSEIDDPGDQYGVLSAPDTAPGPVVEWLMGSKRGLLTPVAIGTIDTLLFAGTRTPHVMLRHLGLSGKVVILDEIHAASVYMSQFLAEVLRWLGSAQTPVVLLTATLPSAMRIDLQLAYLEGSEMTDIQPDQLPIVTGYPAVTAVCVRAERLETASIDVPPWRPSHRVEVQLLGDVDDEDGSQMLLRLRDALQHGGCVLIIRNTVDRAQQTFLTLAAEFGEDVELLHGRLTTGERARRTAAELGRLGPEVAEGCRPRHILVATQVAEQSFDVDVDLLITDIAPIDLLLQRIGRLHRHDRGPRPRPVATPTVLVTGITMEPDGPPTFPGGSLAVYRAHRLLRSAAQVLSALDSGWSIPAEVPALVALGYSESPIPDFGGWSAQFEEALAQERVQEANWKSAAAEFLLVAADELMPRTLGGLHKGRTGATDDELLNAIVRDGEPSVEVVLVRRDEEGDQFTLSGRRLTRGGALVDHRAAIREAVESIIRLPTFVKAGALAPTPSAWADDRFLRFLRPLELDEGLRAEVGGRSLRYDHRLGLVREPS